jgi:hypothetical protein
MKNLNTLTTLIKIFVRVSVKILFILKAATSVNRHEIAMSILLKHFL